MDIENIFTNLEYFKDEGLWMTQIFIIVFLVLLFNYFQRRILKKLHKKFEGTKNPWDDAVVGALRRPLTFLVWILGVAFAAQIVGQRTNAEIFQIVGPAREVGVVVVISWFLIRFIKRIEQDIVKRKRAAGAAADITTVDAIAKLLRISVMITAGLVALQTLGFSISGVLAFGGVGGIAIGFAAKDLLANFFGGLMIYLDRPFSVGDWIRSPDRDIEGTVEDIGWRLTRIRTFDQRPLYLPNSAFASIAVINPSRMNNRRIYETIGIRYDDVKKMSDIVTDVKEMLQSHTAIDTSRTLMVNFNAFAPSSVDFFVYTFTHTTVWTEFHEIKQDVLLKIVDIIDKHGAEIAFPTSTIHVPDESTVKQG